MPAVPSAVLAEALACQQRGQLAQAAQLCHQVVAAEPENAEALHLLGVVYLQKGQPRQALAWIERAVTLAANVSAFHVTLGTVYRALGQPEQAIACYERALHLCPENADAAYHYGLVLLRAGRADEAATRFRQALDQRPGFELAHLNLGNACRMLGAVEQAVTHFRRAVELNPGLGLAHGNLGQLLLERQQPQEALFHCQEVVRLDPQSATAHNSLGDVLRRLGRLADARVCYLEALRREPNFAPAHNNLGEMLLEQGKLQEARPWLVQAVKLQPRSALFQLRLAALLLESHDLQGAELHAGNALRLEPDNDEAQLLLARIHTGQGRLDLAERIYRTLLAAHPHDPVINCRLADMLLELNQREEALGCLRTALNADPACIDALGLLATQLRAQLPAANETTIRHLLNEARLSTMDRASLGFGLAHVCDARGDYDEAARHLVEANRIQAALHQQSDRSFDAAAHAVFVDRLLAVFSPAFFERVRGFGLDSERPVFIVGLPRSGSTLLEQVLASHSRIHGAGELRFAREIFEALAGGHDSCHASAARAFDVLQTLKADSVQRLGHSYLERLAALAGAADRIIDKMLDNYFYVGLMAVLFPRARFLHCCRDLRDVALSCWSTYFREIHWANDFDHLIARFTHYRRLMEHWHAVLPAPLLDVRYEDMVTDLESVARRVVAFLGLEWEPACLEFHRNPRRVQTASRTQVRQPIYRHAVGRWRHYAKALQPLFDALEKLEAQKQGNR